MLAKIAKKRGGYVMEYWDKGGRVKCYGTLENNSYRVNTSTDGITWRWPFIDFQFLILSTEPKFMDHFHDDRAILEYGSHVTKENLERKTVCFADFT